MLKVRSERQNAHKITKKKGAQKDFELGFRHTITVFVFACTELEAL